MHRDYGCLTYAGQFCYFTLTFTLNRFLYTDPTPSALQVFVNRPGESQSDTTGLPPEQGSEQGIWINADPIPGCVVCNIGESKFNTLLLVIGP